MKQLLFSLAVMIISMQVPAQPTQYKLINIHAHNDYDHNIPFTEAYLLGIGSIEADVLLVNDTLFVAHSRQEIKRNVLFEENYLGQLSLAIQKNKGYVYADTAKVLQLLIDIKTDSLQTLAAVIKSIRKFPLLANNPSIRFVITGNQPPAASFYKYPSFLLFDGKIRDTMHLRQADRIGMFSANFATYSRWRGVGPIPEEDLFLIKSDIGKAHALKKAFRFWGVPDGPSAWKELMQLGVDYLNTDHIHELARFLENSR